MTPAILVLSLALAAGPQPAASGFHTVAATSPAGKQVSAADYVKKTTMTDTFEIESSRLALKKTSDPKVKDLANMLIEDHSKAQQQLQRAVASSGRTIPIPKTLDSRHKQMMDQLRNASEPQFDHLYLQMQLKGHEKAIKLQQSYAKSGDVSALQQTAQKLAPVLKAHLEHVQTAMQATSGHS